MENDVEFQRLLHGLRSASPDAFRQFVDTYEPFLRRTIRYRINRDGLQAAFDSKDICQSVLGLFLLRFMAGEFVIESTDGLMHLLMAICNNKFLMAQRREYARKRDRRKTESLPTHEPADNNQQTPSEIAIHFELIKRFEESLRPEERELVMMRRNGLSWNHISEKLGENSNTLRQKLSRAVRRIAREIGLENE